MGKIFYLIGASGSGKDTILRYFREHLSVDCTKKVVIAHRYITRKSDSTEDAIALSDEEFTLRLTNNLFAMAWDAHDLHYGIGCEIDQWRAAGINVIVNGSRAYLPEAKKLYKNDLHSVHISVDDTVIKDRLISRQRETDAAIRKRLARHEQLKNIHCDSEIINNDTIEMAAEQLKKIIEQKGS